MKKIGTTWSEIINNKAMLYIDDERLKEKAKDFPAIYMREMSNYMTSAIPLFNRPPEIASYLYTGIVQPTYADYEWISDDASMSVQATVSTGKTGYDVFSCGAMVEDEDGAMVLVPCPNATYNAQTGVVTMPLQESAGIVYLMDFYKDGSFAQTLTDWQQRILGLCIASVWDERFFRTWVADAMKIHSKSFDIPNESVYMREGENKKIKNRNLLSGELRKYEQNVEYNTVVCGNNSIRYM